MKIRQSTLFKSDFKRLKKKHYDMNKLFNVVDLIVKGDTETLYRKYKDHFLKGDYKGFRECHIEKDWLLIYKIETDEVVLLLTRTGKHDDLF